jgi:L-seryl-tRNA(Ser) seleniumtransferase
MVEALAGAPLKAGIGEGKAQVGGGSLPRSAIPSVTLDLVPQNMRLSDLATRLRAGDPPVIGYLSGNRFKLDLRTIFPRQDAEVVRAIHRAMEAGPG